MICKTIGELESQQRSRLIDAGVYSTHLSPKQKETVAKLVGKQCTVDYQINGIDIRYVFMIL